MPQKSGGGKCGLSYQTAVPPAVRAQNAADVYSQKQQNAQDPGRIDIQPFNHVEVNDVWAQDGKEPRQSLHPLFFPESGGMRYV